MRERGVRARCRQAEEGCGHLQGAQGWAGVTEEVRCKGWVGQLGDIQRVILTSSHKPGAWSPSPGGDRGPRGLRVAEGAPILPARGVQMHQHPAQPAGAVLASPLRVDLFLRLAFTLLFYPRQEA